MSSALQVTAEVRAGIEKLKDGGVIALPTDTLYALAADATNDAAVERVFEIKGREGAKPLPLFVSGVDMARRCATLSPAAECLARRFWPGALTLVLPKQASFRSLALAGGETVALRAPDHQVALEVIDGLGRPLTGTSANRSGGPDPVTADVVRRALGGELDLIIDAGACPEGRPSTIVDCTNDPPAVLREGVISGEAIRDALEDRLPR